MSAVVSKKKRECQSASQAPARHSGEGRNPVTGTLKRSVNVQDRIGAALSASLPEGWRWATLGDTGRYINGVAFKPSDWVGEGLPIIRIQNLTDPQKPLNRTMREVDPIYRVETGDLLVSWSATLDAFLWDREPGLLNQHIFKVVPDENVVGERFLFYLLKMAIAEMVKSEHLHGSTMKHINRGPFLAHRVLIPPLHVQEQIVADIEKQFTRLDAGVAALRRVQANLKRYCAAVLKAACEGRLVPTEAELAKAEGRTYETGEQLLARILAYRRKNWHGRGNYKEPAVPDTANLPPLPEGWIWATVAQLSTLVQYGSSAKTDEDSTGIPVLRMGNIQEGKFDLAKLKYLPKEHNEFPELLLAKDDLLFNRTNSAELVGKTAVFKGNPKPCSFASYLIRIRFGGAYNADLASYFINSVYGRAWINGVVSQQVGQANVNGTKLQALAVPLPPFAEQTRIVAEVERRLSVIEELEAAVIANFLRATRLRQSILKQSL